MKDAPMVAPVDLDSIRARAAAATEGPWEAYRRHDPAARCTVFGVAAASGSDLVESVASLGPADVTFMAHARADIPAMADEIDLLRATLAAARALLTDTDNAAGRATNGDGWRVTHIHAAALRDVLDSGA